MNKQMIRYVLGLVLLIEGALLLLPWPSPCFYREASWIYFIATIGVCLALGGLYDPSEAPAAGSLSQRRLRIAALSWTSSAL